ncbi:MAG TPA: hypothetical protein VGL56_08545 [Fimbriimonadaceae bacterium]|jgi:hypothetical protein
MLAPIVLAVVFQVQSVDPDFLKHPNLPIQMYRLPQMGGQQEIVIGPKVQPAQFFGYYAQYLQHFRPVGNDTNLTPNAPYYESERVGYMSDSVATYPHDGQTAYLIQTDGDYKQVLPITKKKSFNLDNKQRVSYWVSLTGKLLQVNSVITVTAGNWVMSATFGKDSYELFLNDPIKGERKSTINFANGSDKFDALFKPMLDGKKELLRKKEYTQLDPLTGAEVNYTAKSIGHWDGKSFGKPTDHGRYIDIDGGGKHERVYVNDDGILFHVDEPGMYYLGLDDLPSTPVK